MPRISFIRYISDPLAFGARIPLTLHSTNGVATTWFVVKRKQRIIQMLRILIEWIELKYRATYVRSECSIDPTSTIRWNQLFNRGRIYSSLSFAFYCREETRMMERTWRSIRKSTLILLLPLLLAVSTIYDLFDDQILVSSSDSFVSLTRSLTLASQTGDEDFGPNANIASPTRDRILGPNVNATSRARGLFFFCPLRSSLNVGRCLRASVWSV